MPPRLASVGSYSITDLSTADRPDSYRMETVRSRCDDEGEVDGNSTLCQAAPAFSLCRHPLHLIPSITP